ncbi:hypothetical protein [Rossellomorea marisflavi]|uniref:hypothetical protein n=1 Tax=Rossellomorea marisflavi TaxID=189381 RepID=UPI003F9FE4F7
MTTNYRHTSELFKSKNYWNCFGVFTDYNHMVIIRESLNFLYIEHIKQLKRSRVLKMKFAEAVNYMRKLKDKSKLEKQIEDAINQLDLRAEESSIPVFDFESDGLFLFMNQKLHELNYDERTSVQEALKIRNMVETIEVSLEEWVNDLQVEEEMEHVHHLLHKHFDTDNLESILENSTNSTQRHSEMNNLVEMMLSRVSHWEEEPIEHLYQTILNVIELDKQNNKRFF